MIARTLSLALGLGGALTASQLPEFAQQYRQRLGGAIDEMQAVVARFDQEAAAYRLQREEAIRRLEANADPLAKERGRAAAADAARLTRLADQRRQMEEAGPFGRIAALVTAPDPVLISGTTETFEPAIPTTMEGAVAAGGGFLAGWGLFALLRRPFRRRPRVTVPQQ